MLPALRAHAARPPMPAPDLAIERLEDPTAPGLRLSGVLALGSAGELWGALRRLPEGAGRSVRVDLSGVRSAEGAAIALLLEARGQARLRGHEIELLGASPDIARLLELYGCPTEHPCLRPPPQEPGLIEGVGRATAGILVALRDVFGFLGDLLVSLAAALRAPFSVHWRDVPRLAERAGADGLPIVLLINFLVGAIIALQASYQLSRFGADIFVADLVGLATTRELAPLMTAIIVAGRSGAAYAAELGTMRVSEEIDALRVMGIDPLRQLVFPRALAMFLMVPLLTMAANVIACVGGLVVATTQLDLEADVYFKQLRAAVGLWDIGGGLIKSAVFAITITLIACQRGLATRGGAAGVGSATTSAVVTILFALIVWDAIFTSLFNALGI